MKKLLIITYYWPPAGGVAVQRWLKHVKYLPEFGWQPIVFTMKNAQYPTTDETLQSQVPKGIEVIKVPAFEPYKLFNKITFKSKNNEVKQEFMSVSKPNKWVEKISLAIRGNFFIPDARCFWVKPAVKYLTTYLQQNNVDAIASNGTPHSCHVIAMQLKKKHNIPWLADFRDPWTEVDYFHKLNLSTWAENKHKKLEKEVLSLADKVTVASPTWANDFNRLGAKNATSITNGYDEEDFKKINVQLDNKFTITHTGSLSKDRNHEFIWKALNECCQDDSFKNSLILKLIGNVDYSVKQSIQQFGIDDKTQYINNVNHTEAIKFTCKSQLLLLILGDKQKSQGRIPAKVFEYLAAKRPIICIGPSESDVAKIILEQHAGVVVNFDDFSSLIEKLDIFFDCYSKNQLQIEESNINLYSRRTLAGRLVTELNLLTNEA